MPTGPELIIILVICLLIFGKRLPEVGKSLGKGIVEFKKGLNGVSDEVTKVDKEIEQSVRKSDEQAKLESGSVLKDKSAEQHKAQA
jgi:sec-independent protein translocase protein TatA